ncbi:MAG TPA: DUF5993 family protein, partial [Chlamydiales bacterium]|nr:DUF5993 family protein [Chlamydiales bacterium]
KNRERNSVMMAGLFLIFLISLLFLLFHQRRTAFGLAMINLLFCLLMLLHHATDVLKAHL